MKPQEFLSGALALLAPKGDQYNNTGNIFSAIATMYNATTTDHKISNIDTAFVMVNLKLARLRSLLKQKQIDKQAITDTLYDAINYIALLCEQIVDSLPK